MPDYFMVFDVESVGLHGEGFAAGWVVVDRSGFEHSHGRISCDPSRANGVHDADHDPARAWVRDNIPPLECSCKTTGEVRDAFWSYWLTWRREGAILAADCPWPVEARFLAACVDQQIETREWEGPYPFIDVVSVRLAAGLDPLGTDARLPREMPAHDPLADARQSARLLIEALDRIGPVVPAVAPEMQGT